jgi:phage gpG-like protein
VVDKAYNQKGSVQEVVDRFRGIQSRARNWTRAAPSVHRFLLQRQEEMWASQGRSEGVPWQPLGTSEPKWLALKKRLGVDTRPLRWLPGQQERLAPSFMERKHPEHVFRVLNREGIEFGSSVPYAQRHQQGGGTNPMGERIPQRRIAWLSDRNQERLAQLLAIYISRGESRGNVFER